MSELEELLREARGWLRDVAEDVPYVMADRSVVVAVNQLYEGGWPAFVAADPGAHAATVHKLMTERFGATFADRMAAGEIRP